MFDTLKRLYHGKQYGYEVLFKNHDRVISGKPGIILADIGMPEGYDTGFYNSFMEHVFLYVLPPFLHRIVLADRGIALIDPGNPLAREPFKPEKLIDMHGSFTNQQGKPYVDCEVKWRPPGMKKNPWDIGYFLYKNGRGGAPDICQKTSAKVAGWYFGHLLPDGKVAWEYQCRKIFNEASEALMQHFPEARICHAKYVYEKSLSDAVETLLQAGSETIIYHSFCNPVYSDFEDYASAFPLIHRLVNGRAKVVFADQPGNQPSLKMAYSELLSDQLRQLPGNAGILLILSKHGHPFKKETQDWRGVNYRASLEEEMRRVMKERGGRWDIVWGDDEYADDYWDRRRRKFSTLDAYTKAIGEGYDYAIEIPTDFIAENTDLMILHAMKKYTAFPDYDLNAPIEYPDWEKPLVRVFRNGSTTGIYAGCPVGKYRRHIVKAVVDSIVELKGESWLPLLTQQIRREK